MPAPTCSPSRSPRRGFTLIELLVVVAIIALLIAILVTALSGARESARKTVCGTRLRGLLTATTTYLAEFDNTFPLNGLLFPKAGVPTLYQSGTDGLSLDVRAAEDANLQHWNLQYGALWNHMNQKRPAYLCPSDDGQRTNPDTTVGNAALTLGPGPDLNGTVRSGPSSNGYWSYSVNSILNALGRFRNNFTPLPWNDPVKATSVQNPSLFIAFIEEDSAGRFNDEVMEPPAYRPITNSAELLTARHGKTGNLGLLDGHVESAKAIDFNQTFGSAKSDPFLNKYTAQFFLDGGIAEK